jgi:hypothetical protein
MSTIGALNFGISITCQRVSIEPRCTYIGGNGFVSAHVVGMRLRLYPLHPPGPLRFRLFHQLPESFQVFLVERNLRGAEILFQPGTRPCAGDRDRALRDDPGERHLSRRASFLLGQHLKLAHDPQIALHMFLLEPRDGLSDVTLREIARFGELTGEDPFAKRGVGDNLDSELLGYRGGLSLDESYQ